MKNKDFSRESGFEASWPALTVEMRPLSGLKKYARNARKHSDEQIARLAASIRKWGWTIPVLVDEAGEIIAGHGRVEAARTMGLEQVPVSVARGWSEEMRAAYVLADNRLAEQATWDDTLLNFELASLEDAGFDLSLTGFDDFAAPPSTRGKRKSGVSEMDEPLRQAQFWISLRGPIADQARVLNAVKEALGAPGEVEIDTGVIEK